MQINYEKHEFLLFDFQLCVKQRDLNALTNKDKLARLLIVVCSF